MSTAALPDQEYLLLENNTWADYLEIERLTDARPGLRLTYDRGRIEVMTLSFQHENLKMLMHDLLGALAEEFDIEVANGGSTTIRKEILDRGLEPDQCYFIENEPLVRGKDELDLEVDPPPDLAIEIEISRSALDRIGIYAALGVPEIWRTDGETLRFFRLDTSGEYEEQAESRQFPGIESGEIAQFLRKRKKRGGRRLVREFREHVRHLRGSNG